MRPPSVYAKLSCPAGCPCDLLGLLHGPHRIACRLVMILLSHHGLSAAAIAGLLGCDPATVRRWIHCYNTHGVAGLADRPRSGRPRLGSPRLHQRLRRLLAEPKAWTIGRLWSHLGRPAPSQRTLRRRVREVACWRRPRLVAKDDPDRDQILADLRRTIAELPEGAAVLAEDETTSTCCPGCGPPAATRSLVLIVDDPDAPAGRFSHWLAWGIDPSVGGLAEGQAAPLEGRNDFGTIGYRGPCPPPGHGRHRYRFRLHALGGDLRLAPGADSRELERALNGLGNVLAVAELIGTYER